MSKNVTFVTYVPGSMLKANRSWLSRAHKAAISCTLLSFSACVAAQTEVPEAPSVIDLLLPLVIVIVTGAVAWWLVRRRGSLLRSDGPLQLVQVMPIGPRERLLLVKIGERQWLCGATPSQISLLAEVTEQDGDGIQEGLRR